MFGKKKELTVEQKELLARATELEQPIPGVPTLGTVAPCGLSPADKASKQLVYNANNMRTYLAEGQKERENLAESLRNAAKAYGEIDEASASGISGGSGGGEQVVNQGQSTGPLNDTQTATSSGVDFKALKQAAYDIQKVPDQAASLGPFADAWTNYNFTLQGSYDRFRPFQSWTGEAAEAAQASLDQQKEWLSGMAQLCNALSQQALYFADAHKVNSSNHPLYEDVVYLEELYNDYPEYRPYVMPKYQEYQKRSQEVLAKYRQDADNVQVINPPKPPQALKIDDPGPQGLIPQQFMQMAGQAGGGGQGGMPMGGGMPAGAGGAGGAPKMPDAAELTAAMKAGMSDPGDLSMSPAGLGGGGGGGMPGMPGMPDMPLAPAAAGAPGGPSVPVAPAGAGLPAGAIPGAAGAGAPGGGGMGGGMPMMGGMGAHGAGGGSAGKGGKGLGDDQALYTEDRSWTEGVIGNRPRKGPVGKDS